MALDNNLIESFRRITGYNLQNYFLLFEEVTKNHLSLIYKYFSGSVKEVPSESLKLVDLLEKQANILDDIMNINSNRFNSTEYWDLLELIDEIKGKIQTIKQTPKWSRSSVLLTKHIGNPLVSVQLKQDQTIERLLGDELDYSDEHQDWYKVAIQNDLNEESYTLNGGKKLQVEVSGAGSFQVRSVVDSIDKESIKGRDLDKKLTWEDDDLKVLSPNDTFIQNVERLVKLKKGDNTEYKSHGLTRDLVVGSNINSVAYPILTRQLTQNLGRDDTIDSFDIIQISKNQDQLMIELSVNSRAGEEFNVSTFI